MIIMENYNPILMIDEGILLANTPFIEFIKLIVFRKIELIIWLKELKYRGIRFLNKFKR